MMKDVGSFPMTFQRFKDFFLVLLLVEVCLTSGYAAYQRNENKLVLAQYYDLRKSIETQKLIWPSCMSIQLASGSEETICGAISSVEIGNDRWDKKK